MADKNIGSLPQLPTLDDTSSFVVEQQGEAGRVTGAQFKEFWRTIMRDDLDAADQALADAQKIYDTISARRPRWWFTDIDPASLGELINYTDIRGPETPSVETVSEGDYLVFTQTNQIAYCSPSLSDESLVGVTTSIGTMENLGAILVKRLPGGANLNDKEYSTGVKSVRMFESSASASALVNAPPNFASGAAVSLLVFNAFCGFGCVQIISRLNFGIWYRIQTTNRWTEWTEIHGGAPVVTSENGTRYKLFVNDDGTLGTEQM